MAEAKSAVRRRADKATDQPCPACSDNVAHLRRVGVAEGQELPETGMLELDERNGTAVLACNTCSFYTSAGVPGANEPVAQPPDPVALNEQRENVLNETAPREQVQGRGNNR